MRNLTDPRFIPILVTIMKVSPQASADIFHNPHPSLKNLQDLCCKEAFSPYFIAMRSIRSCMTTLRKIPRQFSRNAALLAVVGPCVNGKSAANEQ